MFISTGYELRPITKENVRYCMEVYDSNQDFFILTEGKPATLQSCMANINAMPPGFSKWNKFYVSFWEDNNCVAVMDFLKGYPDRECLYLGLLLVHKHWQGKGVGKRIVNAVLGVAGREGMTRARIAVCDKNTVGIKFWSGLGFAETGRSTATVGDITMNVIVMEVLCIH